MCFVHPRLESKQLMTAEARVWGLWSSASRSDMSSPICSLVNAGFSPLARENSSWIRQTSLWTSGIDTPFLPVMAYLTALPREACPRRELGWHWTRSVLVYALKRYLVEALAHGLKTTHDYPSRQFWKILNLPVAHANHPRKSDKMGSLHNHPPVFCRVQPVI